MTHPYLIAIAGGSCSGKTTLAQHLYSALGEERAVLMRQDDYYHSHKGGKLPNFDAPDALDFDRLADDLKRLKGNEAILAPLYDFTVHKRRKETQTIIPRNVIILEGILILAMPQLRPLIDYSCFIECSEAIRFERRLKRDIAERGRTEDSVNAQFFGQVAPAHENFVEPSKVYADRVISQSDYCADAQALTQSILAHWREGIAPK